MNFVTILLARNQVEIIDIDILIFWFFFFLLGYIKDLHCGLSVLDIHATQLKTGQKVQYFDKYIELRYKNVPSKSIMMTFDRKFIINNTNNDCFYKVDNKIVTIYTKHFSLIIPECGIPDHKYNSPVIVNIYKKEIEYGFKFKIYLTTVGTSQYHTSLVE